MIHPAASPSPDSDRHPETSAPKSEETIVRSIAQPGPLDVRNFYFHKVDHDQPVLPKQPGTVILDLEDGVAPEDRPHRRLAIHTVLSHPLPEGVQVVIRCNGMDDVAAMIQDIQLTARPNLCLLYTSDAADE